jgi:hypothetical protein
MIDDTMRRGLLDSFPNVAVTVLATRPQFYALEATRRPQLGVRVIDPAGVLAPIADPNVIVDGLSELVDPVAFLRAVRGATNGARLFALVANAAYGIFLANFLAGETLGPAHPLVEAEVEPLFTASGWQPLDRIPLLDRSAAGATIPYSIEFRGVVLIAATAEMSTRLSTTGFLVIADPQ